MDFPTQKILIIKLSSLGDIVHSLPFLRSLRRNFPQSHIAWVVEEKCQDLLKGREDIDELIVIRTKQWRKRWNLNTLQELTRFFRRIRSASYDVVIDLQGLIKSGVISWLSGAPNRIGFPSLDCREKPNAWFNNIKGDSEQEPHIIDKNLSLLKTLKVEVDRAFPPTPIPSEADFYIDHYLESEPDLLAKPVIALNPGAGFETKRWNPDCFAGLGDRVHEELGWHTLLTWGPGEKDLVDAIAHKMKAPSWIAPPTDIVQSMALFQRIQLFVGCDTGPLHLCSLLGIPTVSLWGPIDPKRNAPVGPEHQVIVKLQSCSFCFKRKCPTQNECMTEISVDEVFTAVEANINSQKNTLAI